MPRGPIEYVTIKEGETKPALPSLFGRGRRESVLVMLAVAGPLYWHEIARSAGVKESHSVRRELGPLLESELILTDLRPGRRRYVSLNTGHPWYKELLGFARALSRVSMPRVLVAKNAQRPLPLKKKAVKPTSESAATLFGSRSKTMLLLALKQTAGSPRHLSESTGISLANVDELFRALRKCGVVARFGPIFALDKKWIPCATLRRLLNKMADVVAPDGAPRWAAPSILGSEIRTKLVALLAANGPSRYHDLCPALRVAPAQVYAAMVRLIGLGVVRTTRLARGDQKLSFYELDPSHFAHHELSSLGKAIAARTCAPTWKEEGEFVPRPFPSRKRHRHGWLFKRDRKTTILLLTHAAGAIRQEAVATALAMTHVQTLHAARHLMRDGLITIGKEGRYNTYRPDAENPYHAEIAALVRRMLKVQFPDVAATAHAITFASKPKTLSG